MATQFRDGTFSEIKPFDEAIENFKNFALSGKAVAFHVGTIGEIEDAKRKVDLSARLDDLEKEVEKIKAEKPIQSSLIAIPTMDEVRKFGA